MWHNVVASVVIVGAWESVMVVVAMGVERIALVIVVVLLWLSVFNNVFVCSVAYTTCVVGMRTAKEKQVTNKIISIRAERRVVPNAFGSTETSWAGNVGTVVRVRINKSMLV